MPVQQTNPHPFPALDHRAKVRAMAVVIGAAVGDALGAPFEFEPEGTYTRRFPLPVLGGPGEMIGGGSFGWAPGEFTDDTQMGLALAESIIAAGGYDADEVWRWFKAWRRTARDVGITTSASLAHDDWRDVPVVGRGAGNGALMRSFPLALAFLDAPRDTVRDVCLHHAALTHSDPAAGWGSYIAVEMMRYAIRGGDPLDVLDDVLATLPDEHAAVFGMILSASWRPEHGPHGNGSVWGCLAQAVWALRTNDDFESAVVAAVSLGDDADTVACVTGALAGARHGVQEIPSRWIAYVHGSIDGPDGPRHYDITRLYAIAHGLLGGNPPSDEAPEVPAGPLEVAPSLHAADLLGAASAPTDWAVVSLCRTGGRFANHEHRRQVHLIDKGFEHNPSLAAAVDDAVRSVQAFLAEGRQVVVHCHGGRSRTGLVLKAWYMAQHGVTEREAHRWLEERWHRYEDYNRDFVEHLRSRETGPGRA
jgi:ADP-ribosyl-[dinitrogen reductase] hydrolase